MKERNLFSSYVPQGYACFPNGNDCVFLRICHLFFEKMVVFLKKILPNPNSQYVKLQTSHSLQYYNALLMDTIKFFFQIFWFTTLNSSTTIIHHIFHLYLN